MAANYTIRITGLNEAKAALDPEILHKPARNLLTRSGIKVQGLARKKAPYDRGGLRDSVAYEVDPAAFPRSVEVGSNLEYARATELGREPGKMPPVGPLVDWVRRKGLQPIPRPRKDGTPGKTPPIETIAWAIALKIKEDGTKPKPFLLPAVTDAEPAIKKYVGVFGKEIAAEAARRGGG